MTDPPPAPASAPPARVRRPFRAKLTASGVLLALVPLLTLSALLIDINATTLRSMAREFQLAVAHDVARSLDAQFISAENGLDAVGRTLVDQALNPAQALELAQTLLSADELLDHVAVYDAEGALVDVLREPAATDIAVPERLPESLRSAAARDNTATGAVARTSLGTRVWLVVPARDDSGVRAYAGTWLSLRRLQSLIPRLVDQRFHGQQDALFVVDVDKRIIAHADPELSDNLVSMADHGLLSALDMHTQLPRLYETAEFTLPSGRTMVGSVIGMDNHPLGIVVQVPTDVAYASLSTMRMVAAIVVVLVAALAISLAFVLARQLTVPIQRLTRFAHALAARRFEERIDIATHDELAVLGSAMSGAAHDLAASEAQVRREVSIRSDLSRYLPHELVDRVIARNQDMGLGGVRRCITVLFADVVSFTPLVEQLEAEGAVRILNELFTVLTEIVFRHGGTVDKFIGDCVMAFWGAPEADAKHAAHALAAAEDMLSWLESSNAIWRQRYGVTVRLAIGVHSGEAVVGNIGSESRMQYTAIGDVVNVAARLETIARPQQILVTAETREAAGPDFRYLEIGERKLSGRDKPVVLYEVRS